MVIGIIETIKRKSGCRVFTREKRYRNDGRRRIKNRKTIIGLNCSKFLGNGHLVLSLLFYSLLILRKSGTRTLPPITMGVGLRDFTLLETLSLVRGDSRHWKLYRNPVTFVTRSRGSSSVESRGCRKDRVQGGEGTSHGTGESDVTQQAATG